MENPVDRSLSPSASADVAELVAALVHSRQTVLPKRLLAPGPDATQQGLILAAAARQRLADVFAASLLERDPQATPEQAEQAREKAYRAPMLLLAIARLHDDNLEIDAGERLISAGCAVQNMLLTAHALGFGAALTSGKALKSAALRRLFTLEAGEDALCFISVGTVHKHRPARVRPAVSRYLSVLPDA